MKILVQSDDFGFTKGVLYGIKDAFDNGIITCTGLFANMPIVEESVSIMKKYPNICFGIDINVASGLSVSDPKELPTLCNQETGMFIQTTERMQDPRWGKEDIFKPYDEVFREGCAQVERFIKMLGHKPEYLQSHSKSGSQTYMNAIHDVAEKYDIPFCPDVMKKYGFITLFSLGNPGEDPFSYENQTKDEVPIKLALLEKYKNEEYVLLPSHCGYVDKELMEYSRCNIDRAYDHAYLTSPLIKKWIIDNNAELISYRDLK